MKKRKIFISIIFCLLINLSMFIYAEAASSLKLNKTNITIQVGKTYKLKVKGTKNKVKWKTANKKVATVNSKGKVTGKKAGATTVTAKVGKKTLKCKVTVKGNKTLSANKTSIRIKNKGTVKITFKKKGSVNYDISDPDIISCEWANKWNGDTIKLNITGKKNGVTYVTITNNKNKEKVKIKVTVKGLASKKTGKTILKEYIMQNGSINSEGEKFIKKTLPGKAAVYDLAIVYENSTDSFLFMVSINENAGNRSILSMTVPNRDVTSLTCEYIYVLSERPISYSATGTLNMETFSENTNISFTVKDSAGYDYGSSLNNRISSLTNEILQISMSSWNLMLNNSGITMKDIGFLSYN